MIVFGGTGDGDRLAVAVTDGRVFRLRDADYLDGVYRGPGVTVVGAGLAEFLERLVAAAEGFAADGRARDL
ncbi:hypothetical protein ABT369_29645 [Dactylosporangium sp. NPDC000244]|uniref:hypothetical protein n=1 Tax=Dactylosporangium sp. NPDC000244 TaxID=3154365 RepID=UPI0033179A15